MALQWLVIVTEVVTIAKITRTFLTIKFSKVHLLYKLVYCDGERWSSF